MKFLMTDFFTGRVLGICRFFISFVLTILIFLTVFFRVYISADGALWSTVFPIFWQAILMSLSCTFFSSIFLRILSERFKFNRFVCDFLNVPIAALLYYYFINMPLNDYLLMYTSGGAAAVFFVSVFLLWTYENGKVLFRFVFKSFWKAFGISLLAFVSGFICLQGLKNLLFANLSDNWIAVLFTFAFGVLFANLFLSYLPRFDVELHEENSLLWLLKHILFPVYIIHMVILYGYIAKIAYLQEMPIGVMNGYALFATVFYALFYFSLHRENNDRIRMLLRVGGALMIPIFIVQAAGLYIRIFAYGFTSMRYISIACMIFGICVAISGIFGIFARKLLPAAIVIVLFSTLTPLNLIDVPAYDQGMRLKFVVEKYGIVKNGTVSVPMNITSEDEKILKSSFSYLSGNEGAWRFPCVKTLSESAAFREFIYSEKEDGKLNLTHTWNTISVSGYNSMYVFDEYLKNNVLSIETESGTYNVDINKYLEEADKVKNKNIEERMIYKVDENHTLYFSDVYVDKSEDIKIHVSGFLLEKQLEAL